VAAAGDGGVLVGGAVVMVAPVVSALSWPYGVPHEPEHANVLIGFEHAGQRVTPR
jgi:hypothetical protein